MRETKSLAYSRKRRAPKVTQCLILAAGNGSRLRPLSSGMPKPLMRVHGAPLLEHVIRDAHDAGINRFVIVVGYGADAMREWLANYALEDISVTLVENPEYHKDNGVSVLKARGCFSGLFLLLMADHIFEASDQPQVTFLIDHALVAGPKPAVRE